MFFNSDYVEKCFKGDTVITDEMLSYAFLQCLKRFPNIHSLDEDQVQKMVMILEDLLQSFKGFKVRVMSFLIGSTFFFTF
jgi:hypothetical protein